MRDFYTVMQSNESFSIVEDMTFEHQFGIVPAVVKLRYSAHIGYDKRLESLLIKLLNYQKSMEEIYQLRLYINSNKDSPKHWRYASLCPFMSWNRKRWSDGSTCGDCNGTGELI